MSILARKANSFIAEIAFSADCEDREFSSEKIVNVKRTANRVPALRVLSANGNQDFQPFSRDFPPTSDASETVPMTTPSCHILPTNQVTPNHKGPLASGYIQIFRYGMEERFAFHFPEAPSV
ncbi:hypothetical protein TNCV_3244641 [Trichonephila clavipes]|nr:hypothetical protein TNCV_3244641 [Trichonephila clavipes]